MLIRGICIILCSGLFATAAFGAGAKGPPTEKEILAAYTQWWNETVNSGNIVQIMKNVTPIGVRKLDNGHSSYSTQGQEFYNVKLAYTFRTNANMSYLCPFNSSMPDVKEPGVGPNQVTGVSPNQVQAGGTFSCALCWGGEVAGCEGTPSQFAKVPQGWVFAFGSGILIKR